MRDFEPSRDPSWDEALQRLEDFLLAYPTNRALPDLVDLIRGAGLPEDFLHEDERALKVLREANAARPLSSSEQVAQVNTEVELLSLEVGAISEQLGLESTPPAEERRAAKRLGYVRRRLDEIRDQL